MKTDIISQYAPVVIATLDRYETFIPCIESLSECVGADHTEIYIALDYPLKASHWDGYLKIVDYLEKANLNFKDIHIEKRSYNYGVHGYNSNLNNLMNKLWGQYDRLILSEDDNVFSKNFLVYINKGLDLFEEDYSVDSICGYLNYNGVRSKKNTFYRCPNYSSAWGVATWRSRVQSRSKITTKYFRESLSIKNLIKMAKYGRSRVLAYLAAMAPTDYLWINDVNLSTYMILEGKCQIIPTVSLVRNIGVTSGDNFSECSQEIADLYLKQTVSSESIFNFIGTGFECQEDNIKEWVQAEKLFHEKFHWITWSVFVKLAVKRIIKIILGDLGWAPQRRK